MLRTDALPPAPAFFDPQFTPFVAAILDERRELGIGQSCARNRKWLYFNFVRTHLVIENKRAIGRAPEHKTAPWNHCVAQGLRRWLILNLIGLFW